MTTPATTGELTRAERLDRLPFTRRHTRLLVGSGIGWALDAMDVGLISFIMVVLAKQWGLSSGELSWVASIGFVGMAVGASIGGLLADRIGRRSVFALTLLVYGLATGAAALSTGLVMLLVLRFVIGLGLGAELPVASTLVSEYAPARIRGRVVVALESFWAVGWILAAIIGYQVVPASEDGWRWAFAVGVVPAAYALVVRFGLPESVRFLERRGRTEEAEAAVREFEESAGVEPVSSPPMPVAPKPSPAEVWSPALRVRTVSLWLVWFGVNFAYYGAFIWIPTFLVAQGFPVAKSFGFTLVITLAQLPGYAVAAVLVEVWGRRATLATFLAGSAVAAWAFGQAGTETSILVAGCALSFFNLGAWGALYAITPEIYPTWLRATGSGQATAFGRVASIAAPLLVPVLHEAGGTAVVFLVLALAFAVATVATFGLPERRGLALEE
ncbi:MFS transporter [Barrientosiimonas humi]|uniref:MFS transporter n=1 Tax=Barrientosiimonas humi TaxID=999931 RepID=UPI00370D1E6A